MNEICRGTKLRVMERHSNDVALDIIRIPADDHIRDSIIRRASMQDEFHARSIILSSRLVFESLRLLHARAGDTTARYCAGIIRVPCSNSTPESLTKNWLRGCVSAEFCLRRFTLLSAASRLSSNSGAVETACTAPLLAHSECLGNVAQRADDSFPVRVHAAQPGARVSLRRHGRVLYRCDAHRFARPHAPRQARYQSSSAGKHPRHARRAPPSP